MLQLSVTALFYLEDSRKMHLPGMRARGAVGRGGGGGEGEGERGRGGVGERERERERARARSSFGSSIYMFISSRACPV